MYNMSGSLCLVGDWKDPQILAEGSPDKVAPSVRCSFCQARLVNAGVIDSKEAYVTAYARDYGTR